MLKALKNLKESWISVIAIILLLIVQATGDLTLPDYTSKIVNVGIQNGGIEDVAPDVIRKSTMDSLLIFTEDDDKILSDYKEISKENLSEDEYNKLIKKYPALENETLYKLNKISNSEKEELNSIMTKPLMITAYLNNEEMATQIKTQLISNPTMLSSINEKIDSMQDSILEQAAIQEVK